MQERCRGRLQKRFGCCVLQSHMALDLEQKGLDWHLLQPSRKGRNRVREEPGWGRFCSHFGLRSNLWGGCFSSCRGSKGQASHGQPQKT